MQLKKNLKKKSKNQNKRVIQKRMKLFFFIALLMGFLFVFSIADENPFLPASKTVNLIFPDYLGMCTNIGKVQSTNSDRSLRNITFTPKNVLMRPAVVLVSK